MELHKIVLEGNGLEIPLMVKEISPADRYILNDITGITDAEKDLFYSDSAVLGSTFQGDRGQNVEVVAKIGLNRDYQTDVTVSDMRRHLYGLMTPHAVNTMQVKLYSSSSDLWMFINGYMKSVRGVPMAKEPEVQVVVSCLSPYFDGIPFLIPEDASKGNPQITNPGTAPTGFHLEIIFTANVPHWQITRTGSSKKMRINFPFENGDRLILDTRPNNRELKMVRGSTTYNIIGVLSPDSEWLMLGQGANQFNTSSSAFLWTNRSFVQPQHWGI